MIIERIRKPNPRFGEKFKPKAIFVKAENINEEAAIEEFILLVEFMGALKVSEFLHGINKFKTL